MGIKRLFSFILVFAVMFTGVCFADVPPEETENTAAKAQEVKPQIDIKAKSVVLIEASTRKVIFEQASNEKRAPASVTKIMTMLLVMEAVESKKISLSDKVSTSEHAASMGGSQIWLEKGEEMTVDELLKATAIASANDAAVSLAEFVGGSEIGFVTMMNERAKELGMNNTNFVNACGLDVENHLTSAHDIALMSAELLKHKLVVDYSLVWMDTLRGGKTELVNTNKLIKSYNGVTGLKTGTTDDAGVCISASAKRDNMELIAVVLGSDNSNDRFNTAKNLLDYGFATHTLYSPKFEDVTLDTIPVLHGIERTVKIAVEKKDGGILLKKGREKDIQQAVELAENVSAPVEKGQSVGKIVLTLDGEAVGEFLIKSEQGVDKIRMGSAFMIILRELLRI